MSQLYTLYPAYIMVTKSLLAPEKNTVLADLAWATARNNVAKDATFPSNTTGFYDNRPMCLFEDFKHVPEVVELMHLVDMLARKYLQEAYGYDCKEPINMLAEAFCQDASTGTTGMVTHTHNAPINVVYYPRIRRETVAAPVTGRVGRNGEIDFFNPTGQPKKAWPVLRKEHQHSSVFRLSPEDGMAVCFEGYMPHCASQFTGDERVVITVSCNPKMPGKNDGLSLQELTR